MRGSVLHNSNQNSTKEEENNSEFLTTSEVSSNTLRIRGVWCSLLIFNILEQFCRCLIKRCRNRAAAEQICPAQF